MIKKKTEETIAVEEIKIPTIVSIRNFIKSVFIILLSFLCIVIGVFIYQMNIVPQPPMPPKTEKTKPMRPVKPRPISLKTEAVQLSSAKAIDTPKGEAEIIPPQISTPVPPVVSEVSPAPQAEIIYPTNTTADRQISSTPKIMLKDLLQLKDRLDNGESCFDDFKTLIATKGLVEQPELMGALMPICSSPKTNFDSIEKVFLSEKKKALMTYYQMNNPKWLAYLKTFGSSLVNVRRLNPKKQRPKDLLSLAQSALKQKNMREALGYIQKLPSEMKADFPVFVSDATQYVQAQKQINEYILTFEDKGE